MKIGCLHTFRYYICLVCLIGWLCVPLRGTAQAVEGGYGMGGIIKLDDFLQHALKQQQARAFWVGYSYQTHANEDCGYASDFNYPAFTFGLLVADFNDVRLRYNPRGTRPIHYDSRCGTSYVAYASLRRAFFRASSGWSADYVFSNGIGYNTHIYDRFINVDNVMFGSRLSVYFNLSIYLKYRYRQCEVFVGPEFRHLSNGGVVRPNKGINKAGVGMGVRYYLEPYDSLSLVRLRNPFEEKRLYLDISYSSGFRGAQGEWLYDANNYLWRDNDVYNVKYGKDGYRLCYYHMLSTGIMYRYARRYASGVGIDALYEPYNRDVEIQSSADRSSLTRWSFGVAAKHEVFFRRLSMQMALGWYLSRPFNEVSNTTEEYPFYERIGLRYRLPVLNDCLSVGYTIHAHMVKAYGTELVIDVKLPLTKKH